MKDLEKNNNLIDDFCNDINSGIELNMRYGKTITEIWFCKLAIKDILNKTKSRNIKHLRRKFIKKHPNNKNIKFKIKK